MKAVIPLFLLFCLSQNLLGQECTRLNDIFQTPRDTTEDGNILNDDIELRIQLNIGRI